MFSTEAMRFALSADPESTFCEQLDQVLAETTPSPLDDAGRDWLARPFSPLLLGYTGQGNVGADVRVREMVRQMQAMFEPGTLSLQLGVMGDVSGDPVLGPLPAVPLDGYFTEFLRRQADRFDAVIACEGSMFTSTFSDVLSATFAGGLGWAVRRGRPAIGYGAEAGAMSPRLRAFVARACDGALLLARSAQSQRLLSGLGLRAGDGADPAWTFEPSQAAVARARELLQQQGGTDDVPAVALCPINPFWWPVGVDMEKTHRMKLNGEFTELNYRGVFFHASSPERDAQYARYLDALARTAQRLRDEGRFVFLVGMERLDARACAHLNERMAAPLPVFTSGVQSPEQIVALLRQASLVVTSRFHAAVLALGACVPTIGLALDSRIENLFNENGLGEWFTRCDSPTLADELATRIDALPRADLGDTYRRLVRTQIEGFGAMGQALADELLRMHPALPLRKDHHLRGHLPTLSARLEGLLAAVDRTHG